MTCNYRQWVIGGLAARLALDMAFAGAQPPDPPPYPSNVYSANGVDRPNVGGQPLGSVPGPPTAPMQAVRPEGWPGGEPARVANMPSRNPRSVGPIARAVPESKKFIDTDKLAQVSTEVILVGDLMPLIDQQIAQILEQSRAAKQEDPTDEILDAWREQALKSQLPPLVETKLLLADAKRNIPAENLKKIEEQLTAEFRKSEMPAMMERLEVTTALDLERKLRTYGTSIEARRQSYLERQIAGGWIYQQVKSNPEITHEMLVQYYRDHPTQFEERGKAKWEHLSARFEKYTSKESAHEAIAGWGNDVVKGRPLAEVARANSHDPSSEDGGLHDWTMQGALVSVVLDKAIFSLPVGSMSQILEDDKGFHIVRVVERIDAHKTPFGEVQAEIKKKIKNEKADGEMKAYMDKVRSRSAIWTKFDPPSPGNSPAGK